ncbi:MAG: choloylglycine hydrolase [Clostridia bacterium]|nr:choloylglycine hydrolase [Clostridia bacterium]
MCTAINTKGFFGRNLDWESDFGEEAVVLPRSFPLSFRHTKKLDSHYAIMGISKTVDGYPLFFDAMNEKGLGAAGLNFVGNAVYNSVMPTKSNVASFEFIPYVLTRAKSVADARVLLKDVNIVSTPFSHNLPPSQLHFIIADEKESITVESVKEGLKVYPNPAGVLTNNPPFPYQMNHLTYYMNITNKSAENRFSKSLDLKAVSRGMGGMGLPGDTSSPSRFVRASFVKENSPEDSLSQFFHLLACTEQVLGATEVNEGEFEMTEYTSAYDRKRKSLFYTTYTNRRITEINTKKYDLDGHTLLFFPLRRDEDIFCEN